MAGFCQVRTAHAVDAIEPVLQSRHRRTERRGNGNAFAVDRLVKPSDRWRHAFGIEFVDFATIDLAGIADAVRHMQHCVRVGEAGVDYARHCDRMREQRPEAGKHRSDAVAGERCDLQPALFDDRPDARRRQPPVGERVVVHLGDIDISTAARRIQRTTHNQRTARVALDQQDDLAIAEQRCERTRHRLLRIAAGGHDDDLGAIDSSGKFRRRVLDGREAAGFHIHTATRADFSKPRVVQIMQSQPMPRQTQLGDQIDAADAGTDDRDRCHAITPVCLSSPSVSRS